ncbi:MULTISPECIES: hypothetical protein [Cellvibrio]|uniref:Uncharacterized LabA/DUF88 family protein n=1 Tax=Cellvibrio fibrivorans TaxID=126350 RepID=A0ABU1V4B5_9GAMM|nr:MULTISPECIES: hypothetical protein [Cellvibrio]MDR7092128.1 uncharacterized LabA/DUF88 family protein [Cellvibrio fibrivorans]UUA74415.1 hypothetical protein NNX04_08230 [Cellvibrio sp. QJXJ]
MVGSTDMDHPPEQQPKSNIERLISTSTSGKGYYSMDKAHAVVYKSPPDKTDRVEVWKLEEKQTEVATALTAYWGAQKGNAEQLVFISNDTDLEPALMAIREDYGNQVQIGVVLPIGERPQGTVRRPGNNHWVF